LWEGGLGGGLSAGSVGRGCDVAGGEMLWGMGGVGKGGKEGFLCINGIVALMWGLEIFGWDFWGGGDSEMGSLGIICLYIYGCI
jgi:hypothetical protein